jgi:hypothetical protein
MTVDPELVGYTSTYDAVTRLAANISDREIPERVTSILLDPMPSEEWPPDRLEQAKRFNARSRARGYKRETAILELYDAFCRDKLSAIVRDPHSGEKFKVTPLDWRSSGLWRQTIVGGVVVALPREHIDRYSGRVLQIETKALDRWLKERPRSGRIAAADDCLQWLKAEMRANPERCPRKKSQYLEEAKERFGSSQREFDRLWAQAKQETGANWKQGRPKKDAV